MKRCRLILCAAVLLFAAVFISCVPPQRYDDSAAVSSSLSTDEKKIRLKIVLTAKRQIGIPYRMGGMTPRGFDCSGLTMYVYRKNGLRIPRTAAQQYRYGRSVALRSARPGDLLFFDTNGPRVSHVAVYLGRGSFVHAPSRGNTVRTDSLKNPYWKSHYCGAVRYIR